MAAPRDTPQDVPVAPDAEVPARATTETAPGRPYRTCRDHLSSILGLNSGVASVYYRVYTEDGAIPSKHPLDSNNPYVARIEAHLVTPPHTVASIKRYLSKVEKLGDRCTTRLYTSASSATPAEDGEHVAILTGTGPGSTPEQPLALVRVEDSDSKKANRQSGLWLFRKVG
jgi:hypothetical protein